jgi:hypothetical protein
VAVILFLLFGGGMALFGGRDMLRARDSLKWPTAPGTVTASSVGTSTDETRSRGKTRRSTSSSALIVYRYEVDGVTHHGSRVAYGDHGSNHPSHARKIVDRYPVGKIVTVYHMPGNPGECLLEPGLKLQAWVITGFGVLLAAAGIVLWVLLPRLVRKK